MLDLTRRCCRIAQLVQHLQQLRCLRSAGRWWARPGCQSVRPVSRFSSLRQLHPLRLAARQAWWQPGPAGCSRQAPSSSVCSFAGDGRHVLKKAAASSTVSSKIWRCSCPSTAPSASRGCSAGRGRCRRARIIVGRNCISTFTTPSPWQASQQPPPDDCDTLKLEAPGVSRCPRRCWSRPSARGWA